MRAFHGSLEAPLADHFSTHAPLKGVAPPQAEASIISKVQVALLQDAPGGGSLARARLVHRPAFIQGVQTDSRNVKRTAW
jgi:hypothetical protein